ncbi:phage tail tape measure protein [Providencia stuartii]
MATNLADLRVGLLLNDASFRNNITGAMDHAGRETARFSKKAKKDAKSVSDGFNAISTSVINVSSKLAMLGGVSLSIGSIMSVSRKYSQALSDLSAITGATGEQLKAFDDAAQKMGRTTEFGAASVVNAMKKIASAKPELVKTAGAIEEVTEKSITLAQASGIELADAASSLSLALNQFGASASNAERYINVLAAGSKYGSSEINETAQAIKVSGTVAAQANIGFEELNASIQVLAGKGVKGAEAGRMLRNVILSLERSTDKNLRPSVVGLGAALENLDKKNYSTTASVKLFGRANVSAAVNLRENTDKMKALTNQLTGTSTAYEQASARANNLSSDIDVLTKAVEGMAVKIGQSVDGPLRTGVQNVTSSVNSLTNNFSTLADVMTYVVLPIVGARMTSGLQAQVKTWYQTGAAARESARQTKASAKATIEAAQASKLHAQEEARRLATQTAINRQHGVYVSYQKEHAALRRQITEATKAEIAAKRRLADANRTLSISQRTLNASTVAVKNVYSALGGPVGVLALAGSALYYFHNKAEEARNSALNLKDAVVETTEALMLLSRKQLNLKLINTQDELQNIVTERNKMVKELNDARSQAFDQKKMPWTKDLPFATDWEKEVTRLEANVETVNENIKTTKAKINNIIDATTRLDKGEKPPKQKEDQSIGDGGSGGDGNDLESTKSSKQKVSQYHQLRMQIEQEHATSLERISLSESETMRKLQENMKAGGMKQGEYERLKTLNAENHMKQRAELAEKYSPMRTSLRNEQEMTKELKSLFEQRLLTEKEYQYARMQMDKDMSKYRLSEQAKGISLPNISILGEIDPVIQLRNQLEEQKALYQAYYEDGLVSKERYEQLIIAATNKSKEAQYQSSKELYASTGSWQKMQMNLLDAFEQRTSNALTGMLTGSKSFSESLQELSSTLASSIISDLIRIAIQAQITNALTGLMGGFAGGGSASVSARASSANAGAMGMSTSWQSYVPNAKGGVYSSPSLSQYSNQVISSPTLFAFAKGAGLMGEAGPEAIMPLARGPDGSLGVRATGSNSNASGDTIIHQTFHVHGNGDAALEAALREAARQGAEEGAAKAKADIMRDFQTNGKLRKTLGK